MTLAQGMTITVEGKPYAGRVTKKYFPSGVRSGERNLSQPVFVKATPSAVSVPEQRCG